MRAILLLPITTALFVFGWIIYRTRSKPHHAKKTAKSEKTTPQDIEFVMLEEEQHIPDEEEHLIETYA